MAKAGDMEKLNGCLDILDSTDLGLSMVWLWTWSIVKDTMKDEQYKFHFSESEVWDKLLQAVDSGHEISLEYGAEQHYEEVIGWLQDNHIMTDMMFEEEE